MTLDLNAARYFLLIVVFSLYVGNKYRKYRRLQNFPGPFSTGWSEAWHVRTVLSKQCHLKYKAVSDKYGRLARIGPNELLTSSPELIAHMSAARSPYTRSTWYNSAIRMRPGKDNILSQLDEEKHNKRRQQMAAGYSGKENAALELDIDEQVQQLLALIRTRYTSSPQLARPVDIGQKIQYFTLDVISRIGFGKSFGNLEADADLHNSVNANRAGMAMMTFIGAFGLIPYTQWPVISKYFAVSEKDKTGMGRMMHIAHNAIEGRMAKPFEGRSDMLASFKRHGLNQDELLTESMVQIIAGSDTTATALRSLLLYVATHPPVYNRLQKEVDDVVAKGSFSSNLGIVSDSTLRTLPYLQAVVREGLRMHPAATSVFPKKVPAGGDTVMIDGKQVFLPGGTNVSYSVLGVQHDKVMFGEDADFFHPERWLLDEEKDEKKLATMRRTTDMIFGHGKYQCLGKPVAWMEITKVLFEFMHHFEWTIAKPEKPWRSPNTYGIFLQDRLWVTATERVRT